MNYLYSQNNSWHSVSSSPWPIVISLNSFAIFCSFLLFFYEKNIMFMEVSLFMLITVMFLWFSDIFSENMEGEQTYNVKDGLKVAMLLFIASEVLFFIAWFWGFFHNSLSPINEVGNTWPPTGILPIEPFSIPLLNTFLLLSSGVSVTWAHNSYFNMKSIFFQMVTTIFLGIIFTVNQCIEYIESNFSVCDSIYGSTFFITTGFHGIHVIIGSLFLGVTYYNITKKLTSPLIHYISFEFAIWYWHFVDVVWLFLMTFMYLLV